MEAMALNKLPKRCLSVYLSKFLKIVGLLSNISGFATALKNRSDATVWR